MMTLRLIQDFMNGKTKNEIDAAVESGRFSFDTDKYQIVSSKNTCSGYMADLMPCYKNEMHEMLGRKSLSMDAYMKLDAILSDGFELDREYEEELYVRRADILYGTGKRMVKVYCFKKDNLAAETDTDGTEDALNKESFRELILFGKNLVKGSISMARNRSDAFEAESDEIISRQDFVMELFGTDRKNAAFVTTMLQKKADDEFDEIVENLYDYALLVMNSLSICSQDEWWNGYILKGNHMGKIRNFLFSIALPDETMKKNLALLFNRNIPPMTSNDEERENKVYIWKVNNVRSVLTACMKKELEDVLWENDIQKYRKFVNSLGKYEGGATCDIGSLVSLTGMEKEVVNFILQHGDKEDFVRYVTRTFYDSDKNEKYEFSLGDAAEKAYQKLSADGKTDVPVSYKYLKRFGISRL